MSVSFQFAHQMAQGVKILLHFKICLYFSTAHKYFGMSFLIFYIYKGNEYLCDNILDDRIVYKKVTSEINNFLIFSLYMNNFNDE